MKLRQIEIFRAVMVAGSVTDAARLLHVSQPGVSRMLGHIELQLGFKLFERVKGRLQATPPAQVLYEQVEQVYLGVRRIDECVRDLQTGKGLSLRVLSSPNLALEVVPRAIAETSQQFPDARFYLETQMAQEMERQLLSGQADLGIASLPIHHALLKTNPLGRWRLCCVFPSSHRFSTRRTVGVQDLLRERLIGFSPDTPQGRQLQDWCAAHRLELQSRVEVRSGQAACALVRAGAGIALVDDVTAHAWRSSGLVFRPVKDAPTFSVQELRRESLAMSELAKAFVKRVRTILAGLQRDVASSAKV